jgi:hypothetical protein
VSGALSRLAINQWTVRTWGVREAVEGCARHGIGAIGLWREHVAEFGLARTANLVRQAGLRVSSLGPQPARRRRARGAQARPQGSRAT